MRKKRNKIKQIKAQMFTQNKKFSNAAKHYIKTFLQAAFLESPDATITQNTQHFMFMQEQINIR